ncbi:MAG: DUF1579 family protein [Planctomycetes bacterium]|nr:DUF1579 family protein [Planctomycetota bacterium]
MRALVFACVLFLVGCQAPDPRRGPPPGLAGPGPAPVELEAQVAELAAASRPTSMHARIDPLAGTWTVRLCEVEDDFREREWSRGTARLAWVHGGRFLAWTAELERAGTTSGFLGYDVRNQQYQLLMISSLSTGMGVAYGYGDVSGQGIRFTQEAVDPPSGRRLRMTSLLRLLDRDHFVLDAHGLDAKGVDRVVRRTHYERVPAAK